MSTVAWQNQELPDPAKVRVPGNRDARSNRAATAKSDFFRMARRDRYLVLGDCNWRYDITLPSGDAVTAYIVVNHLYLL